MLRGGGGGDEDIKGEGAPKYFLALKGGGGSESSRYTGRGAINSKFWSSRGLECSLNRIETLFHEGNVLTVKVI
jgi:hypothetical protein